MRNTLYCFVIIFFVISFKSYAARAIDVYNYSAELIWASQNLKAENYHKAFKHLEAAAKLGNKTAQYRLSLLYLNGQGVEKSFIKAYLWSRVAAETKNKSWRKLYKALSDTLTPKQKQQVAPLIKEYISLYGMEEQEISCHKVAKIGSNIKRLVCNKRLDPEETLLKLPMSSSRG